MPGIELLRKYAGNLPEKGIRAIYENSAVLAQEWDWCLRLDGSSRSIGGFMSSKAIGAMQQASREGVALLTMGALHMVTDTVRLP